MDTLTTYELDKIRRAIESDLSEEVDVEGRSELDLLIEELKAADNKEAWGNAALSLIEETPFPTGSWWRAFERLLMLGGIRGRSIGAYLEALSATPNQVDPQDRATVYGLQDWCGAPPTARTILNDLELKRCDRVRWLDLIMQRAPGEVDAQPFVLEAIQDGAFSVGRFIQRLDVMRSMGGDNPRDWFRRIRTALPLREQPEFDRVIEDVFGITATADPMADAAGQTVASITAGILGFGKMISEQYFTYPGEASYAKS